MTQRGSFIVTGLAAMEQLNKLLASGWEVDKAKVVRDAKLIYDSHTTTYTYKTIYLLVKKEKDETND